MARSKHIDAILRNWPYEPGSVTARLVKASDGREVLQMRIDMGVVQMEVSNRPDGARPGGAESYFDYLMGLSVHEGTGFMLTPDQCQEVDREFAQYYHRRICWLALREFDRAVKDADHNLSLMDFVRDRAADDEWCLAHEQFRPYIVFHRTQAAAMGRLEADGPEDAIEEINLGLEKMREIFVQHEAEEQFDDDEMVRRLLEMQESLRDEFGVQRTLEEQLADAIADEQYELAARLRDEISQRRHGGI